MTHVTCRLTAKSWDQLRNPTLGNRYFLYLVFAAVGCADTAALVNTTVVRGGGAICSQHYCSRLLCDVALGCADTAAPVNTTAVRSAVSITVAACCVM